MPTTTSHLFAVRPRTNGVVAFADRVIEVTAGQLLELPVADIDQAGSTVVLDIVID